MHVVLKDANEDSTDQKQNCTSNCLYCVQEKQSTWYIQVVTLLPISKLKDDWILFYTLLGTAVIPGKKVAQNVQMFVYTNFTELSYDHYMVHVSQLSD